MSQPAKDLTKKAAAGPSHRVGGYVILARLADKASASFLGGNLGEYHTDCPLDHCLLDWKDVSYDEIEREFSTARTTKPWKEGMEVGLE